MAKTKETEQKRGPGLADYGLFLATVVTEKTAGNKGMAVFKVQKQATKDQIKAAVEKVFKVEVASVRTVNYLGKMKRTMRSTGKTSNYKKAYVTLKPGHAIDMVEGV